MNARSLKFRLSLSYAVLMTAALLVGGIAGGAALKIYLEASIRDSQFRRARQMAQSLLSNGKGLDAAGIRADIDRHFDPAGYNRFARISRGDGSILYVSPAPKDESFDPAAMPPPIWPDQLEAARTIPLPGGRRLLTVSHHFTTPSGDRYMVEAGSPLDSVGTALKQWLILMAVALPILDLTAVGAGYWLLSRALRPVREMTESAERITSHNLDERLPASKTGDELEHLALALNRMIGRLDDAFQNSRRFVADASHELRTPLTILRGELEGIISQTDVPESTRESAVSLLEEVERLANIVEGLFALSRLDAGESQRESIEFDLGKLAATTTEQLSLLAEDKSISLKCDAPDPVIVQGDRGRLKQVIVNLLDNAIKYTPEGGDVRISVRTAPETAILEVTDSGIGIPKNALPHIFERFYRVDKARSRDQGGAGLGLAIAKAICTGHRGHIEVSSEPGIGSRFRVELPLPPPAHGNFPLKA